MNLKPQSIGLYYMEDLIIGQNGGLIYLKASTDEAWTVSFVC